MPTIMFIRHAEKPEKAEKGVTPNGEHDEHSLSVRGWTRAGALAALFANPESTPHITKPSHVIATAPSDSYKSKREHDTALPTAQRLGVKVDATPIPADYSTLASSIRESTDSTLVVWHHGSIPAFIASFPVANSKDVPAHWPESRFDVIWVLQPDGEQYTWHEVNQELLDGDVLGQAADLV
jgi:broad specificity phosphatase PhoE